MNRADDEDTFTHEGECLTAREWAEKLGLCLATFRTRVHRYGPDDPRLFRTLMRPVARPPKLTWDGVSDTAIGWANRLGVDATTFHRRMRKFGVDDPRTFHAGARKRGRRAHYLSETVAGSSVGLGRKVVSPEEQAERVAVLDEYLAAFPWLASNSAHLREESVAVCASIRRVLGELSLFEVAHVLGSSRQRVQQVEDRALKKCKLAGGAELREAWDWSTSKQHTPMGEWMEQGALMDWGAA